MSRRILRRDFLKSTVAAGSMASTFGVWGELSAAPSRSPNEKLNIAAVGTQARAWADISGVMSENIVALCDVDANNLGKAQQKLSAARPYRDFRQMLDKEEKQIDAVVIGTPDHIHAPATMMALRMGKHCYCEKPLTHTVFEARAVAKLAAEKKLATQMGTQIHATENYRRVVEVIQSGAIGPVREVHVWVGKGYGGKEVPKDMPPVPDYLDWDLWLGPAPVRPYHSCYHPFFWRDWWAFGQGTLGDMACHYMDLPFWALDLRYPTTVEAEGPPVHPESCPKGLTVRYEFPARGERPPVALTWHDGNRTPREVAGHSIPGSGVMFIGDKGQMFADYGKYVLYPESEYAGFKPPAPTIPRSIGHHQEWIKACKEGTPTTCNFDYSGALTEAVLLGNVAYRTGQRLEWDAESLKAVNCPQADAFVQKEYRKGWSL